MTTAPTTSPLDPAPTLALVSANLENAMQLMEQAERAVVSSIEELDKATDFMKICTSLVKRAEDLRTGAVAPLNSHVKWINGEWKPVVEKIEAAKRIVQVKATTYATRVQAEQRAAQAAAQKIIDDATLAAAQAAQDKGQTEIAELIVESAANTRQMAPVVTKGRGSLSGATSSLQGRWVGAVQPEDVKTVCAAIASGVLPASIISFSQGPLNMIAKEVARAGLYHGISITNGAKLVAR